VIVYFDASALVPLYARDRVSRVATTVHHAADRVATSFLSYAEVLAALGQLHRRRRFTSAGHRLSVSRLIADWPTFERLPVNGRLLGTIRRLLEAHPLKGADAVQLASALQVLGGASLAGADARFACDDHALATAAVAEGLVLAW